MNYIRSMRRITDYIRANLRLQVFLPLLSLALLCTWFGLFWSVDHFAQLSGGLRFMDMQPRLETNELFEQIRSYSDATARFYLGWSLFDFIWPFVAFTTMCFISAWLGNFLGESWRARLWILIGCAYTTVLMDWLENVGFMLLVTGLPAEPLWLARTTLLMHNAKLFFNFAFNLGFLMLMIAVITIHIRAIRADR